jgi:hypothetical protein
MSAKVSCTLSDFVAEPYAKMSSQEIYKLHLSVDHDLCPYCYRTKATEDHVMSEHIDRIPLFNRRLKDWVDAHRA